MGVIQLANPHHFVKEAAQVGIFYDELLEACECSGVQKISRMFAGKSIRGGQGHASGVTIDNWLVTFKFARDNPDVLDTSPYQARSITPTKDWHDYLKIIREPIDISVIDHWKRISKKSLGDEAEKIGITKGIRNDKALTTLLARMKATVERRRKCIWNIDRSDLLDTSENLDSRYSNVSQVHKECQTRNIPIGRQSKDTLVELVQTFDQNPPVPEEITNYTKMTKAKLHVLCKDRGFIMYNKLNKDALVDLLSKNDTKTEIHVDIEKGSETEKMPENNLLVTQYSLELANGDRSLIPVREDGYIDATVVCKAGKKKFNDWIRLGSSKDLMEALESESGITASLLIETYKGGDLRKVTQGSWIHPDLAIQLAQWVSPKFAIQVSRWMRELFRNGSVVLERPVRAITDMSQIDIEAEILENEYDWSTNTNCNSLYIAYVGNGLVKVGTSDSRLTARVSKHTSTESAFSQFRMIATYEISSRPVENEIHCILRPYQELFGRQKEVYKPSGTLREFNVRIKQLLLDNDHKLRADRLEKEVVDHKLRVDRLEKEVVDLKLRLVGEADRA
jgi:uncharacterized protein YunC (DUF1805 family)